MENEKLELDATGECYFAALIYGLSLINEKEAEQGKEFGSTSLSEGAAAALLIFVRRKGDMLVRLMQEEEDMKLIRWNPDEIDTVAAELRRLYPGEEILRGDHCAEAQKVLPADRRKPSFDNTFLMKMRQLVTGKPAEQLKGRAGPRRNGAAAVTTKPPAASPVAVVAPAAAAKIDNGNVDSIADILATQIETTLRAISVTALERAAERMRGKAAA